MVLLFDYLGALTYILSLSCWPFYCFTIYWHSIVRLVKVGGLTPETTVTLTTLKILLL